MPADEQLDQGLALTQPASQAGPAIPDRCRATRVGDLTDLAECLAKTNAFCRYRLAFTAFFYCVHPRREAIIARTLAAEGPPAK